MLSKTEKAAYQRAWRKKNLEKVKEQERAYRNKNRERRAAYGRVYSERNREQIAAVGRAWWAKNGEREQARRTAKLARKRGVLSALKVMAGCSSCGFKGHPAALDFHHERGEKVTSISVAFMGSPARLIAELNKCEVLCANCHRIEHAHDQPLAQSRITKP